MFSLLCLLFTFLITRAGRRKSAGIHTSSVEDVFLQGDDTLRIQHHRISLGLPCLWSWIFSEIAILHLTSSSVKYTCLWQNTAASGAERRNAGLCVGMVLAVGHIKALVLRGSSLFAGLSPGPGSHRAVLARVMYRSCSSPFADTGFPSSPWT